MKTMTLITASLLGLATMTGSAFAASSTDMSSQQYRMRHAHHSPRVMQQHAQAGPLARGTYGAPRQQIAADRNAIEPASPRTGNPQLVIPGSDTAIYAYSPTDPNRQYGY